MKKSARISFRLYIAGDGPNSIRAEANLKALCNEHFPANHEIEIVDAIREPERALADGVILTPTLVRLRPLPLKKIIGDLSEPKKVLAALGL